MAEKRKNIFQDKWFLREKEREREIENKRGD